MPSDLSPSLARVAAIARALGELRAELVFIGGAIAPILQTDPVIPHVRATSDVDAVIASTSYSTHHAFTERLRAQGFTQEMADARHVHRWRSPEGIPFDVVPSGEHLGATSSDMEQAVMESAVETELEAGLSIRHASAPGFAALKWAAFHDRGADNPFNSHDLEDIFALMVSRRSIVLDFESAPARVRDYCRDAFRWLLASPDYDDLVAAHLRNAVPFKTLAEQLKASLYSIVRR